MPGKRKKGKKFSKLRGRVREISSEFIAEEIRTRQYPRAQAIAIGISRAQSADKKLRTKTMLENLIARYS